jgi:23S rRNA (adenine-N6)-dimethyltransferase
VGAPPPRWGWHRLDPRWAERLVSAAAIGPGDLVLDVGAGLGALTTPLVRTGARVIAVELHPGRAERLRGRFGDAAVIVHADAADLRLPRRPYHVVANPPFAVTTALLRRILQPGSRLESAHLVLQEQAARRSAGATAPGAGRWSRSFTVRLGPRLPRQAFAPPPRVGARVLVVERR